MTALQFSALLLLGFVIGNISSFFGVGGGAFLVPALVRVAKLEWDQAIALSLLQIVPTSILGAWRRFAQNEVRVSLALATIAGTIPGSWAGRMIVGFLKRHGVVEFAGRQLNVMDACLTIVFFVMLMFMAARMAKSNKPGASQGAVEEPVPAPHVASLEAWLIGLAVGLTSSLLGIGGGFLFVPLAVQRFKLPVVVAVGTSLFQMPITSAFGAATYLFKASAPYYFNSDIPLVWLIPILAGSLTGVMVGITLSRRFNNTQYRRLLAGMLAFTATVTLVTWLTKII